MRLTLAAVGAVVTALLQLTVVPYLRIGDAQPDLVLVFAVTATVAGNIEAGLVWAFIGGLMIDLLAPRPLGMTSFMLLVSVAIAASLGRILDRARYIAPVAAVFVASVVSSILFLVLYGALRERSRSPTRPGRSCRTRSTARRSLPSSGRSPWHCTSGRSSGSA